jgi:hypothetical protein
MLLIISDNIVKDKITEEKEFSRFVQEKHVVYIRRDSSDIKIPRIGEVIYWYNSKNLLVENIVYKYRNGVSDIDDTIFVFGSVMK